MDTNVFRKTIFEVLKYDNKFKEMGYKENLMKIISRSKINSVPQYDFAIRSYQHWEIIELRVPVPLLNEANELKEEINKVFEYVYEETDEYALQRVEIKPMIIDLPEEYTEYDVHFDEIEDTLIQGIRGAKFVIWAAVAWFSNDKIFRELKIKKDLGLNVRLIVSDEKSNESMVKKLKENEFDVKVIKKFGYYNSNRMHDKFCIIDLDYIMHGSYNWSQAANYNNETLATALDRNLVSSFAEEFMCLYTENN
ncbi:phospholipase D-like domain-containing protein [Facklamia sp. P13055]|uniref:phospholipase D-like domain-containing protein n=1 Tax=Facklamia sp. P13055 TaxID=3421952 RepID=UPI003D17FCB7